MLRAEQVRKAAGLVEDAENVLYSLLDVSEAESNEWGANLARIIQRLGEIYNDLEDLTIE